jgi:hypothetical protein
MASPGKIGAAAAAVVGAVSAIGAAGFAGLRVQPEPFAEYSQASRRAQGFLPLPGDLPQPVHRWLHTVYGDQLPVIESVVVTGRARVNPFGLWLPARFRFIHDAGRSYRHYIEATVYGRPVMTVNERYVDGRSLVNIPFIGTDEGPKVEQAANIGMWAELAAAAPAVLATDDRVQWRAVDATTAILSVPLGPAGRDEIEAHFDPDTGMLSRMDAWRYRSSKEDAKVRWTARNEAGPTIPGSVLPAVGSATWADQGRPWAVFTTEDVRYNVDVGEDLRREGL